MSMYFRCRLLHFCVTPVLCVLSTNGAIILLWVLIWHIFFSTSVRQSYVELTGYWRLEFWNLSFGTSVRQSDVETPGSWRLDFGTPGSWLMSGLVSTIIWLIQPSGGTNMRLWLALWRNSVLITVWWLGGWFLVKIICFVGFIWAPVNEEVYLAC